MLDRSLLLALALVSASGCGINFDIGPYDVGTPIGDLQGAPVGQCPPTLAGGAIIDEGDSCRITATYEGVFVDGQALTADVDAGIAAAATVVGYVTRVRKGSIQLDAAQILGDDTPPDVTWRDVRISLWIDGGTEHVSEQLTVPNPTGISFSAPFSSPDLSVVNAVLDAPTTSDLSGDIVFAGSLSLDDIQVLSNSGALSLVAEVGADITVGL